MKQNITSLSVSELESLCEEYLAEHCEHTVEEFIDDLYHHKHITVDEYKNVMAHEKIELTSFVNINDTNDNDETKWSDLADVEVDSVKIPWADFNGDDYTILESIDEGAMGEILLAKDNKLNRKVAYK